MVKFIIGVDQAVRNTAYTVMDNAGTHIESYNIATTSGTPDHVAVDYIVEMFFERLAKYFAPDLIAQNAVAFFWENPQFHRTGDKTHVRSEVSGALRWNIRAEKINVWGMDPGALNSFLDNRAGLRAPSRKRTSIKQKAHTMDVLHRHFNFYTKNDNIADSYVAALFGYAFLIEKQRLTAKPLCKVRY